MQANLWWWILFHAGVLSPVAIDLLGSHRKAHAPSTKEAAAWTTVWVALSLGFGALVWQTQGPDKALEFLTGYFIEYSLSLDNLFVFVLIFSALAVPAAYQHRVLFWGVLSALVLRGAMIGLGVQLVERFHGVLYLFGAFLLFTGLKMFFAKKEPVDVSQSPVLRFARRFWPVTDEYHGARFSVRIDGRRWLTPLALVLLLVEATDVAFALDSIPAIFGVTQDPFIVYTSNVCAILGLRSLYFLLAGSVEKFVYLKPGLALVLAFIGIKMLLADVVHLSTAASLGVVGAILAGAIGLSFWLNSNKGTKSLTGP
jgi:tellurite resistance protein TerC